MKIAISLLLGMTSAFAQIDAKLAQSYFKEADTLCTREGGRLWGVSLCGPMLFADPNTHSFAANRPVTAAKLPDGINVSNTAFDWEGVRWSMMIWPLPAGEKDRGRLMIHELWHRIQGDIGLPPGRESNEHLDTRDGRVYLQLEMRALTRALKESGKNSEQAIADALAFRKERQHIFPNAAATERTLENNEGLAEYTATVALSEPVAYAVSQLDKAPENPTFVRSFAYSTGLAYGLLLDHYDTGWRKSMKPDTDLAKRLAAAANLQPAPDLPAAAARYDAAALMTAEDRRETERRERVAAIRMRFVEGPVLTFPNAHMNVGFDPRTLVPVEGSGNYYPAMRVTADWGVLEISNGGVIAADWSTLTVPVNDNWNLKLNAGWIKKQGQRTGDLIVVRDSPAAPK